MAITEQVTVQVAAVGVTDEYRVELTQHRKTTDYTPDQADQLATDLSTYAAEARRMLAEHIATDQARIWADRALEEYL